MQTACRAFPLTEDFLGSFKRPYARITRIFLIKGLILMWSVQTYRKITHWRFTAGQEKPCKGKYIFVFVCVYVCVCCIHRHHEQQIEAQPPYAWTWPAVPSLMQKERKKERTNCFWLTYFLSNIKGEYHWFFKHSHVIFTPLVTSSFHSGKLPTCRKMQNCSDPYKILWKGHYACGCA